MNETTEKITVADASIRLNISETTILRLIHKGEIHAKKTAVNGRSMYLIALDQAWNNITEKYHGVKLEPQDQAEAKACAEECKELVLAAQSSAKQANEQADMCKQSVETCREYRDVAFEYRTQSSKHAFNAKCEAESAMRCVVWAFCSAVLALLFAAISIIY